jgi:hypothetical protein
MHSIPPSQKDATLVSKKDATLDVLSQTILVFTCFIERSLYIKIYDSN